MLLMPLRDTIRVQSVFGSVFKITHPNGEPLKGIIGMEELLSGMV